MLLIEEIVQNYDEMRRAKLHKYQVNLLRKRKNNYLYGVSKLRGIHKRKYQQKKW